MVAKTCGDTVDVGRNHRHLAFADKRANGVAGGVFFREQVTNERAVFLHGLEQKGRQALRQNVAGAGAHGLFGQIQDLDQGIFGRAGVDGRYDFQSLGRINALLRDRRSGRIFRIDPELVDFLVDLRTRLALPPSAVFEILSGYRESETNAALRREDKPAARNSLHVQGRAVDFRLVNVNGRAVAEVAKTMQRGGVSYYPGSNHVHLDTGALRSWAAEQ